MKSNYLFAIAVAAACLGQAGTAVASEYSAGQIVADFKRAEGECSKAAPRFRIAKVELVSADRHNRLRRELGAKQDGTKGRQYAMLFVNSEGKAVSVESRGPVTSDTKVDQFSELVGRQYCAVDED